MSFIIKKITEGLAIGKQNQIKDGNSDRSNFCPCKEYYVASNKYLLEGLVDGQKLGMSNSSLEGETFGINLVLKNDRRLCCW